MPRELFTSPAHWTWLIVVYFFVGGIAGGSFFIAAMLDLVGNRADRSLSRLGYLVALPGIAIGGPLLILDLGRKERFWHMLVQSETFRPMFKWWSPISFGTWIVSAFGAFAFVAFLAALVRSGDRPQMGPLVPFHKIVYGLGPLSKLFLILGALTGLALAGYTGMLLSVTNRPVWANMNLFGINLLGLLFLASAVSAAAATLYLLGHRRGAGVEHESLHALTRFDDWVLGLELLVLIAAIVSLASFFGSVSAAWLAGWGALLIIGVLVLGILVPLVLYARPRMLGGNSGVLAAILVLVGSFLLRTVVVMSSETIESLERVAHGG